MPQLVPEPARLAREVAAESRAAAPDQAAARRARFSEDDARARLHRRTTAATSTRSSHPYPVLEWGLRWCELNAPEREETTFVHRDYRTGNYLVHDGRLAGILDWEFAAFGNPLEDIGWICVRYWRFARPDLVVGGIAGAEDFIPEYERVSGRAGLRGGPQLLEGHGNLRWAVVALQQLERHLSGAEPLLEQALTGHVVGEIELEILDLTEES